MFWGPTPWMWSYWWICPLIGLVLFVTFMLLMRRMMGGHGPMCLGGHGQAKDGGAAADLQREVRALREEVDRLRATR